jgi:hypothetical protein
MRRGEPAASDGQRAERSQEVYDVRHGSSALHPFHSSTPLPHLFRCRFYMVEHDQSSRPTIFCAAGGPELL